MGRRDPSGEIKKTLTITGYRYGLVPDYLIFKMGFSMKGEVKLLRAIGLLLSYLVLTGCGIHKAHKGKDSRHWVDERIISEKAGTRAVKEPKAETIVGVKETETERTEQFETTADGLETMLVVEDELEISAAELAEFEEVERKLEDVSNAKLAKMDEEITAKKMLLEAKKKQLNALAVLVEKETAVLEIERLLNDLDFENKECVTTMEALMVAENQLADALEKTATETASVEEAEAIFKEVNQQVLELEREAIEMCRSGLEADKKIFAKIDAISAEKEVGGITPISNISFANEILEIMEEGIISEEKIVEAKQAVTQKESSEALKTLATAIRKGVEITQKSMPVIRKLAEEADAVKEADEDIEKSE
jgi:hypothetical protein